MNAELRLQCLRNLTDLLSRTFKGLFVFPVLGHDDTVNFSQLAELWSTWLPQEALDTLKSGTYDLHSLHPCPPPVWKRVLSLALSRNRETTSNIDRARSLNFPPLGTILIHSLMNLCLSLDLRKSIFINNFKSNVIWQRRRVLFSEFPPIIQGSELKFGRPIGGLCSDQNT